MLPAGVELRPSLQLSEKVFAVGFPGESVPDPFATGELARVLPGVLARVLPEAGANCLVVDMRNVEHITPAGVAALKSMRSALRGQPFHPLLVVRDQAARDFLDDTGVTSHLAALVGEGGLRAWINEVAAAEKAFAGEGLDRLRREATPLEDIVAEIERLGV